jgi:hypothetical protein
MMGNADKKTRIIRDLQGDLFDANHATRRFFRCWLDGSYLGYEHYQDNIAYLRQSLKRYGVGMALEAKVRPWVINQFVTYTAHDADCSYGYAQKVIVEHARSLSNPTEAADFLVTLTEHLITEALDLIEDDIREYLKNKEEA